ncbi:MAG: zinc finger HIT domain-containing protein [Promethearchaeia archaeon]
MVRRIGTAGAQRVPARGPDALPSAATSVPTVGRCCSLAMQVQLCGAAAGTKCKLVAKGLNSKRTGRMSSEEDAGDTEREAAAAEVVPCAVCVTAAAKYKCPRCFVQTCSLPCVRRHKEETKCR